MYVLKICKKGIGKVDLCGLNFLKSIWKVDVYGLNLQKNIFVKLMNMSKFAKKVSETLCMWS